jgi:NADH-quinone oxidoreductase subunit L
MPSLLDNPAAAQSYLWAIILLPLAGALVNGLFGRRLGRGNVALIALAMVGGSFLLSLVAFAWAAGGMNLPTGGLPSPFPGGCSSTGSPAR